VLFGISGDGDLFDGFDRGAISQAGELKHQAHQMAQVYYSSGFAALRFPDFML
jgi:hypothetical protein